MGLARHHHLWQVWLNLTCDILARENISKCVSRSLSRGLSIHSLPGWLTGILIDVNEQVMYLGFRELPHPRSRRDWYFGDLSRLYYGPANTVIVLFLFPLRDRSLRLPVQRRAWALKTRKRVSDGELHPSDIPLWISGGPPWIYHIRHKPTRVIIHLFATYYTISSFQDRLILLLHRKRFVIWHSVVKLSVGFGNLAGIVCHNC